ncbi:type I restriction enzyme S subunit [Ureibacillus xyleni]|uniref:Type I restriction enzyme S subunit n=1 Tax=Ureibacillus xyleni TaxID=614648 RepID=A0A285SYK3_9BACL|nr:restriction endonuclease subunit S [Ureibacillus xyleni]SOC13489.1 type I restriction enzyme S subunit [Ureibacillus xyleni]
MKYKIEDCIQYIVDNRGKNPERYVDFSKHPIIDNFMIKSTIYPDLTTVKRYIDEETYKNFIRNKSKKNDVLVTLVGNGIGNVTLLPDDNAEIIQNTIGLRANPIITTNEFLYYCLRNKFENIIKLNRGTSQPSVKKGDFLNLELDIPPLKIQSTILNILLNIDYKIHLNGLILKNLEEISQTLFKHWFIDFEFPNKEGLPYKSSGGKMVESELGEIPTEWRVYSLEEFTESISKSINKKEISNARFLNTSDILEGKVEEVELSPTNKMPGQAKKLIQRGDILYSEIRPKNKRYAFIDFDASEYVVSTKLMVLRVNEEIYSNKLLYQWLTMDETIYKLQQIAEDRSGTFPQITFSVLSKFKFAIPEKNKLNELLHVIEPMLDKKQDLIRENEKLIELRDSLLPKLLTGEIEIPDESVVD